MGMVRRFQIGNKSNYFVVKTEDIDSERPIYLQEPKSQLLDHVQLQNMEPSLNKDHWKSLIQLNKQKRRKNMLVSYWKKSIYNF